MANLTDITIIFRAYTEERINEIKYLARDTKNFPTKELYRIGHLLQTGNYVKASYNLDNASRIEKWSQEI